MAKKSLSNNDTNKEIAKETVADAENVVKPETVADAENVEELENVEEPEIVVRSESEIIQFEKKYQKLCEAACTRAGMSRTDKKHIDYERKEVWRKILMEYATGKWKYDPNRGTKESSYVYMRAYFLAKNFLIARLPVADDDDVEKLPDDAPSKPTVLREDARVVFREALNRLALECGREQLEILARYVLAEEDRRELARLYSHGDEGETVNADRVSVIKNRWLPRLMAHAKQVVLEDEQGVLKLSPNRISFLKPYLKWL